VLPTFLAIGLLFVGVGFRQDDKPTQSADPKLSARELEFQKLLRDAHNKERKKADLPALVVSARLANAASLHAKDMAQHHEMTHDGSDGSKGDERVHRAGYLFIRTGENVAAGHKTVAQVLKDWMTSDGHRANILGDYSEIGGARVLGDDGVAYWVVEFATPVPKIDAKSAVGQWAHSVNELRKAKELEPLTSVHELDTVAAAVATELATQKGKVEPTLYQEVYKRVETSGYQYKRINLSIARAHWDAGELARAMGAAVDSEKTVLGTHKDVGVGVGVDSEGVPVWVVLLATRLDAGESVKPDDPNQSK
jgi:uncharacterized protein YkwD